MPKVMYGISPIGLGHATRSQVVVGRLRKAGVEVLLFSGGRAAEFLEGEGLEVADVVSDPVPGVSDGVMKRTSLWYLRSWLALRRSIPRTERLFDDFRPDLVVCDEEFSGLLVAEKRGVRRVLISDELELGFARSWLARKIEGRVFRWYKRIQDSVDVLIVPDFGVDSGNRKYVEPIVREVAKDKDTVLNAYGLPTAGRVVLFSMSGSGIGGYLLERSIRAVRKAGLADASLVVTGNRGTKVRAEGVFDLGVVPDNQNLVSAADLVISTAGKSTIDEAAASGTPIIVVPIKNHAEQERNAASLGYSYQDLERLAWLIGQKIGKKETGRRFRGAENASRLILSMLSPALDEQDTSIGRGVPLAA